MSIPENKRRVAYINEQIENGKAAQLVAEGEAYHEEQLTRIAQDICSRAGVRVVLIAGPSSSGKTSTSIRLCLALLEQGKQPVSLSLDNWFLSSDKAPVDEDGNKDYESVYALDLAQLDDDLDGLLAGEEVELPTFNFKTGQREYNGDRLQLTENNILVVEGIHALNPILFTYDDDGPAFEASTFYKIYAAPMSPVTLDGEKWIPTSTHRLLRRMSRDLRTRGKSPQTTIAQWQSVRDGEAKWIEPFHAEADAQFDTSMTYEIPAIRSCVETALQSVPAASAEYEVAERLLYYLSFFESLDASYVPRTSILREFIGGSQFNVG
ncbi:MAG: nucleoside kinase [Paludibacteraceae bacterium]|nr:nucleoside kinase [Paludibacteraceae bacterium]